MLRMGSSKPWQDAMEALTGGRQMTAVPLVEYFTPLIDWLKEQNGEDHGWEEACPTNIPVPPKPLSAAGTVKMSFTLCFCFTFLYLSVFQFL